MTSQHPIFPARYHKKKGLLFFPIFVLFWGLMGTASTTAQTLIPVPVTGSVMPAIVTSNPTSSGVHIQSAAPAPNGSELTIAANMKQNYFQVGDINLSQGCLNFSKQDLVLPGKGGMDLAIGRSYNSAQYQSVPEAGATTKPYGWHGTWMVHEHWIESLFGL